MTENIKLEGEGSPSTPTTSPAVKHRMPSTAAQVPTPDMFGETVEVKVGVAPNMKNFTLHKGVLAFSSGYFEAAMRKDTFLEGENNCIELPDEDPECFEKIFAWMYTRKLHGDGKREGCKSLIDIWILSDKYIVHSLGIAVMDLIRERLVLNSRVPAEHLEYVYNNTLFGCGFRHFILFIVVVGLREILMESASGRFNWTNEIFWDVLEETWRYEDLFITNITWEKLITDMDVSQYHYSHSIFEDDV